MWANSAATYPPPRISSRSGSSSILMTVSLVWNGTSSRPSISGTIGREPAATTIWSAVIVSPVPVSRVCASRKRACPSKRVTWGS